MKVLVAPLDWGLGHATRCVPVVREFLRAGAEVELAVVKANANFFREVFPDLRQRLAPSYNIVYPKHGYNMALWLLKNSMHLNAVMRYEHHFAEEMVKRHGYDVLFSDNRFAFYSKKALSIYMTHQRRIAFPRAFAAFERIGVMWHANIMRKFDEVWVPDLEIYPGYAGSLSHSGATPGDKPMRFVGTLSRFSEMGNDGNALGNAPAPVDLEREVDLMSMSEFMAHSANVEWDAAPEKRTSGNHSFEMRANYKVVAVVSGVEPARTQFEQQLRDALAQIPGRHMMILGKPSAEQKTWTEGNIEFHTHLATNDFAEAVKRADFVVSRGGYSTVMDMAELGAKCIFVPTPGQFEQIVLAHDLSKAGYAVEIPADELSAETLTSAFEKSVKMPKVEKQNLLHDAVEDVVRKFKERLI
ncbi:Glycosyltransferase 28 domain protein [Fibrobacter succinogenes subsp. succinogenes S85]|uniref:Glycosyltransferase 28 domain protein n=1 Tax=Fibrobacter succinogenes (strain ATCC 19169 / S85) TaxID=59374 RepID=A0ABM5LEI2_FIBSS|nr:glycosyltransferase [Fibrobacter succinogenes]ACX73826.1 Glycosyltransferase 28 domain protein [Fibrobacter succinogenes subsp. succinogenes S85]